MQKDIAERLLKKRGELFLHTICMGRVCKLKSRNLNVEYKEAGINID
jgi:hypothetical protein